jgi:hypothetical protein
MHTRPRACRVVVGPVLTHRPMLAFDRQMVKSWRSATMPAMKKGLCNFCRTRHTIIDGHSLLSQTYRARFRGAHGRELIWADEVAHLPPDLQERWQGTCRSLHFNRNLQGTAPTMFGAFEQ